MSCQQCDLPDFDAGGPADGCLAWKQGFNVTVTHPATSSAVSQITAERDTLITGITIHERVPLTAPGAATISLKDEEGDVILDNVDANVFRGIVAARPVGTMVKRPPLSLAWHQGQAISLSMGLTAGEALNDAKYSVMFHGRTDRGCTSPGACILPVPAGCKPFFTTKVFSAGAGTLPADDFISPESPMTVTDVLVSASIALDTNAITMMALAQEASDLSLPNDVRAFSQNFSFGNFRIRTVRSNKRLSVKWSGDAPVAATNYLVTLVGYRKRGVKGCGC